MARESLRGNGSRRNPYEGTEPNLSALQAASAQVGETGNRSYFKVGKDVFFAHPGASKGEVDVTPALTFPGLFGVRQAARRRAALAYRDNLGAR